MKFVSKTWHPTQLLKLLVKMCEYEMDPASIVDDTGQTRFCPQMDRQTDKVKPVYPPSTLLSGRYNKLNAIDRVNISVNGGNLQLYRQQSVKSGIGKVFLYQLSTMIYNIAQNVFHVTQHILLISIYWPHSNNGSIATSNELVLNTIRYYTAAEFSV